MANTIPRSQIPLNRALVDQGGLITVPWSYWLQSLQQSLSPGGSGYVIDGSASTVQTTFFQGPDSFKGAVPNNGYIYLATDTGKFYASVGGQYQLMSPAYTGDVTKSQGSTVTSLADVFNQPGTYGSSTQVPILTVDSKGRVIAVQLQTIAVTVTPGGINGQIQYNSGGTFGGASGLTYDPITASLTVSGDIIGLNAYLSGNIGLSNQPNTTINGANLVSANYVSGTLVTGNQPNITNVGTLSSLSVTGNIVSGNINSNRGNFTTVTGTLTTGNQPNITNVGTLTSLSVSGNANVSGNAFINNNITANGNITANNFIGNTLSVSGNVNGSNVVGSFVIGGNVNASNVNSNIIYGNGITSTGNVTALNFVGSGVYLSNISVASTATYITNGNSNVFVWPSGPVTIQSAGVANVLSVSSTGSTVTGNSLTTRHVAIGGQQPSSWNSGFNVMELPNSTFVGYYSPTNAGYMGINSYYNNANSWIAKSDGSSSLITFDSNGVTTILRGTNTTAGSPMAYNRTAGFTSLGQFLLNKSTFNYINETGAMFGPGGQMGLTSNVASGFTTLNYYNQDSINNGYRFYVNVNGGIYNYSAFNVNLSDIRVKTDISDCGSYLDKICRVPVRTFKYKDQSDNDPNIGIIAQELEEIIPELVSNEGFGEMPTDGIPLKTVYQTDLQYVLMKCIQEQQVLIKELQTKVIELEQQVNK